MKRIWVFATLCLLACEYDLGDIPSVDHEQPGDRDGAVTDTDAGDADDAGDPSNADAATEDGGDSNGGSGGRSGRDGGGGGSDGDPDAGEGPPPICEADAQRCHGTAIETCAEDGQAWSETSDCEDLGCNPVSVDCYACMAPTNAKGVLSCAAARAEAMGAEIASVDTATAIDAQTGSCGGGGSPDQIIEWIAPASDYWVLDTHGSDYDTVLYARDCACDGTEIACNNNAAEGSGDSELVAHFDRGQRVAVVIDGNAGDKGNAVLNANTVACPTIDLKLDNLPASFVDKAGDLTEAYRFTPLETAFYAIRLHGDVDTRVCLQDGARCGGPELGCSTSVALFGAEVIRELHAGSPVTLVVTLPDGSTGFDLDITKVEDATCADPNALDSMDMGEVTDNSGNYVTPSCAPAGVWDLYADADFPFREVRIPYTFDLGSNGSCKARVITSFPSTVYLLRKDCGGPEAACVVGSYDAGTMLYTAVISIPSSADAQDYVLVVEYTDVMHVTPGTFGVTLECIA